MNICSEYYDNNEEYKRTHPSMLEKVVAIKPVLQEKSAWGNIPTDLSQYHRSVLNVTRNGTVDGPVK